MTEDNKDSHERLALVDSHAHLEELEDLPDALEEAKSTGICGIVAVGMDIESNQKVLEINAAYPRILFGVDFQLRLSLHGEK